MSVGGGKILSEGETEDAPADVYPLSTFADIKAYCASRHMRLWQYAEECEGTEIWDYLKEVWRCMQRSRHPRFRDRRHLKRRFRRAAQSENALPSKSHR